MPDGLNIKIEVDAERTSDEFKRIRRNARKTAGDAAMAAGEKVALPAVRRNAPGFIRTTLTVKRRGQSAVLTTRLAGKKARVVGLLEFGGTVRTTILPRQAQALITPAGPRARVSGPRRYKGKHFLSDAITENRGRIEQAILEETMKAFENFETSHG